MGVRAYARACASLGFQVHAGRMRTGSALRNMLKLV